MAFLNPLLLFGALGVAAPIIIHLLARRQVKRVVWAAMRFLKVIVEKNQKRMTMEDILLLVLRCLVLVFLAVALARPSLKTSSAAGFGGSDEAAIIAIDNSGSMAQNDGASSKFAQAQLAAEQVLDSLPTGSAVAVWLVSDVVKGVIPEPTRDFSRARKAIRDAERSDRGTEIHAALRQAIEVLVRNPATFKQLFLITDGQAAGWKALGETRAILESAKDTVSTRLVLLGESEPRNLALTGLRMASALAPVNEPIRFEIEVTNAGDTEAKGVQVSLAVDAEPPADEAIIDAIPAGESQKVSLFTRFRDAGFHHVTARVPEDRAPADDQRVIAVRAIGEINVLLVDGDPGVEPRESEVFYLRNALTPVPPEARERYFIKPKVVTPLEFESVRLSDYEAVFLANVAELPESSPAALERYVRAGGGLIVFPGSKINAGFYNDRLFTERALLPAAFDAVRGNGDQQDQFFPLQSKGYDHPIVSLWNDASAGSLATARFRRVFTLQPARSDVPQKGAAPPAVVLRYSDGQPAVMERAFGFGRVVQFSSSADAAWNDLCIRPIFVPLVHRVLGALLTRQDENLNVRVGAKFVTTVPADLVGKDVRIVRPGGKGNASLADRAEVIDGQPILTFDATDLAGGYDVQAGEDATPVVRFAAQADPAESRLAPLSAADLRVFDGVAQIIQWTPQTSLRTSLQRERTGTEFWLPFAVLALGLAIAETVLGNRFSRSK